MASDGSMKNIRLVEVRRRAGAKALDTSGQIGGLVRKRRIAGTAWKA